ncbi:MAG: hypothetical protein AAF642_05570 [Pseudomonadota bacterium]
MKELRTSAGSILSIFAIVISLSALGVSVFEVTSLKDQQKASVWPYLEVSPTYSSAGFEIKVQNKGIGPALLGDVKLFHDGKHLASSQELDALILTTIGPDRAFSYDTYRARDVSNSVLSPGEDVVLFGVPWTADTRAFVEQTAFKFSAEGCFCSVYEDCWTVADDRVPEPAKACRKTS